jgi:hypothetical protein
MCCTEKSRRSTPRMPRRSGRCWIPDVEWAIPGGLLRGPDQAVAFFSALWEAFPDIELTATRVAEKGSTVVMQSVDLTYSDSAHPIGVLPPVMIKPW